MDRKVRIILKRLVVLNLRVHHVFVCFVFVFLLLLCCHEAFLRCCVPFQIFCEMIFRCYDDGVRVDEKLYPALNDESNPVLKNKKVSEMHLDDYVYLIVSCK